MMKCGLIATLCSVVMVDGANLYTVAGVVVNGETGSPLAKARVFVSRHQAFDVLAKTITGDDGRFPSRCRKVNSRYLPARAT